MKKTLVNPNNTTARPDGVYNTVIESIAKDGVCPFCPENLTRYHNKPIIEKKHWWVTDSRYPYQPVNHHCLIIHKSHIAHIGELSPEAWTELFEIVKNEASSRSITGGTLMLRFGDTRYTGASVLHLHAHLIQSDPDDPSYDPKKGILTRVG